MKFGYARVSSTSQNLSRQLEALKQANCKRIFSEKKSGKNTDRPELEKMLDMIHEEDEVVVQDLDRLGRNSRDISEIMDQIRRKHATFTVLSLPSFEGVTDLNLKALLNNIIIEIYKYQAEAERLKIKERQRQGIKLAKDRGVYKGGSRKYAPDSTNAMGRFIYQQVLSRLNNGVGASEISKELGIGRQTVYRIKKRVNEEMQSVGPR